MIRKACVVLTTLCKKEQFFKLCGFTRRHEQRTAQRKAELGQRIMVLVDVVLTSSV